MAGGRGGGEQEDTVTESGGARGGVEGNGFFSLYPLGFYQPSGYRPRLFELPLQLLELLGCKIR
jgi:hypothetical protein